MKSQEQKRVDSEFHQISWKSKSELECAPNLISEGIEIHGTYLSPKDAYIEGTIEGGVEVAGKLFLRKTGVVRGNVIANEIVLAGMVNGNLRCKGRTTIKDTARVKGNIYTVSLVVEEDAVVEGEIYMSERGDGFQLYQGNGKKSRKWYSFNNCNG